MKIKFAIVALLFVATSQSADADPPTEAAGEAAVSMKEQRKAAANRRRRIIFNNDGAEPVMRLTRPSRQDFLDARTTVLLGSQVDSIFYCPRCSGFGLFTYFTKVGEVFTTTEGRYENNQMEALLREGIDPLEVIVDFCKHNDLEVFCSFRMNDNHDGTLADYAPLIFRANKFKQAHPELLLGTPERRPKIGAWAAVDYGRAEIRDLAFRFAEEVCNNYDIDGVELDFFRHAVYFKSTSRGKIATDEERNGLSELIARIRKMADEVGRSRGRPILIAVRVPDSVEYCHAMGLDLERWLADDLLDLYVPAGTFQLNDWDYSVELGRKYGVEVYPSVDDSRVREPVGKELRMTDAAYRGRAANVWASGADGVYLYNFSKPQESGPALLHELGSTETLAGLDKDYLPAPRGVVNTSAGNLPYEQYQHCERLNPDHPKTLFPGKSATAKLLMGPEINVANNASFTLRLRFKNAPDPEHVRVTFNELPIELVVDKNHWLNAPLPPKAVHRGRNEINVSLAADAPKKYSWTDLVVEERH
jgi:hypothetical protein